MKKFLLIGIVLCSFFSVKSQIYSNLPNVSVIYKPSAASLHPQFFVYNLEDDYSEIYMKVNLKELNFVQLANRTYQAKLKLKFIFYRSLLSKQILDSTSKVFALRKTSINSYLNTKYRIKVPAEHCYLVIISEDLYNKQKNISFIEIDKTPTSSQNILIIDSAYNYPVFNQYFSPLKSYFFMSDYNFDSILIKRFLPDTSYPYPPASALKLYYKPTLLDSFYIHKKEYFKPNKPGYYTFTFLPYNFTVSKLVIDEYFPYILQSSQMLPPLKYITTTQAYHNLTDQKNKKLAIDDFWLNTTNDINNAKVLIKIYYNRVQMANYYFSSYKEGWKTDRGMIYIVLGPPSILHKGDNFEEWIYYNPIKGRKEVFYFKKQKVNSISSDYVLKRNQYLYDIWENAVNSWQKGEVYVF